METIVREGDMLILANNQTYMVTKVFEYDGDAYMCLVQRSHFDAEKPVMVIGRERVDGDKVVVDIVGDPDFIAELTEELEKVM